VDAHITDRVEVNLGGSLANAHLVGPQPLSSDPSEQLEAGQRLGAVPRWTANASAAYTYPLSALLSLKGRVDYTYQSSRPTVTPTESPAYFVIGPSNLTSLHVLLERCDAWTFGAHVENLFDVFAPESGQALDSKLIRTITAAPPRTVSLTWTSRF
jgi:outer membrane receptor protein involved in Fe transport